MQEQRTYSLISRVLYRGKIGLDYLRESYSNYVLCKMSRDSAKRIRRNIIKEKGRIVADKSQIKKIKQYCNKTFGDSSCWPWLAVYTELRGEFKEGWIPDDYYRFELLPKLNPEKYMRFSEAKMIDHKLFKNFIIDPIFYRSNGQYFSMDGTFKTRAEIKKMLNDLDEEIIIKPDGGHGGQGIVFQKSRNLDFEILPAGQDFVFHEVLKQHSELHRLYPHSVNTFRVTTYMNGKGKIEVMCVILRFGRGGSRVDNVSSGGSCVFVRSGGKIEEYAYNDIGLSIGDKHPDTGIKFADLEIPFYDKVITLCKEAHREFPFTRLVGWDVYVNEKAEPKLIEWNANNPSVWNEEALFGPLFKNLINY